MNSWIHDTFGMRYYKEASKKWFAEKIYPLIEECVQISENPNAGKGEYQASTQQINKAYKAFGDLVVAIKAMGHRDQIVDDRIFFEEATKYLNNMSINGKFKISGEDRFKNKFDYYQHKDEITSLVFDSEKANFLHITHSGLDQLDQEKKEAITEAFELPFDKIEVGYLFRVMPDGNTPPRYFPIHSPHVYRYGTIGFAFLMSMPFQWATETDYYQVCFNYFRKGAHRSCTRRISLLNGDLPYVRYCLDQWYWEENPVEYVSSSIQKGNSDSTNGLSEELAQRMTLLLYYVNIVWLIECNELNVTPENFNFSKFIEWSDQEKSKELNRFERENEGFLKAAKLELTKLGDLSGSKVMQPSVEQILKHFGLIPGN